MSSIITLRRDGMRIGMIIKTIVGLIILVGLMDGNNIAITTGILYVFIDSQLVIKALTNHIKEFEENNQYLVNKIGRVEAELMTLEEKLDRERSKS